MPKINSKSQSLPIKPELKCQKSELVAKTPKMITYADNKIVVNAGADSKILYASKPQPETNIRVCEGETNVELINEVQLVKPALNSTSVNSGTRVNNKQLRKQASTEIQVSETVTTKGQRGAGNSRDESVSYEIKSRIGTLGRNRFGWTRELNIISWNDQDAGFDIRSWSPDHHKMSRGVNLNLEEFQQLYALIGDYIAAGNMQS